LTDRYPDKKNEFTHDTSETDKLLYSSCMYFLYSIRKQNGHAYYVNIKHVYV